MITVGWTAPARLDLEGTDEELSLAAEEIRDVPGGQWCGISAAVRGDPAPYDEMLSLVLVESAGDRLRIRVDGDHMVIRGPVHALCALSDLLDLVACQGSHAHVEWHPGHPFLDAESVPLVVSRRRSDAC